MMGSSSRAEAFAKLLSDTVGATAAPQNLSKSDRCQVYKVGRIMSMSHGMGSPSCLIFLHEVAKLLFHAKADLEKVQMIRLGTSGGLGVKGGSVVLTEKG